MIELQIVDRKSPVLAPAGLPCLWRVATINLTAGCAHGCIYCYTRGYRNYPGQTRVNLYANTLEKLRSELRRKRTAIATVYFSPSSDLFQPVPEVLEMAHHVLALLLERGIRVVFLTKGAIPEKHRRLLGANAPLVCAEIGLTSLNDSLLRLFEPFAAPANERLRQIGDLVRLGIGTDVRLDPIIPGFTDDESCLRELIAAIAVCGVKSIAASRLFLRPAIITSLQKNLPPDQFAKLMAAFSTADRVDINADNGSIRAISAANRCGIYDRVKAIAAEFGIQVSNCACKNPDLARGSCGIAGHWQPSPGISLPLLFQ